MSCSYEVRLKAIPLNREHCQNEPFVVTGVFIQLCSAASIKRLTRLVNLRLQIVRGIDD